MKRTVFLAACLLWLSSTAYGATIKDITLAGGNLSGPNFWVATGDVWNTIPNDGNYVLGVSATAAGDLLNNKTDPANYTSIDGLAGGHYLLNAIVWSGGLGTNPKLDVTLSDNSVLQTIFTLSGDPGTANYWARASGSSLLALGWAEGTADKVTSGENLASMSPDAVNDHYFQTNIVPLPGGVWLLGAGLLGLGLLGGRRTARSG